MKPCEEAVYHRLQGPVKSTSACIGLDGFVDRILYVVRKRTDSRHFERVETLAEYGKRIMEASGLSLNMEMVPEKIKFGGNGPIMAGALARLGIETSCVGAFGDGTIHPVFQHMEQVRLYSFGEPANTDAVEFLDGKLISSVLDSLNKIRWNTLKEKIGLEIIKNLFGAADLIAMNNWTMIPSMTQIWESMKEEVFPYLKTRDKKRILFFDLADPGKRDQKEVAQALQTMNELGKFGIVVLSCNESELGLLADSQNLQGDQGMHKLAQELRQKVDLDCIVVHRLKEAFAVTRNHIYEAGGWYTPRPRITTGGGDHFNAGFCFGLLQGWSMEEALCLGNLVSGYYVRTGTSPGAENLRRALEENFS